MSSSSSNSASGGNTGTTTGRRCGKGRGRTVFRTFKWSPDGTIICVDLTPGLQKEKDEGKSFEDGSQRAVAPPSIPISVEVHSSDEGKTKITPTTPELVACTSPTTTTSQPSGITEDVEMPRPSTEEPTTPIANAVPEGYTPLEEKVPYHSSSNQRKEFAHPNVNFHLAPGDVLVTCCYDASHKILATRFPTHLRKCQRNYEVARQRNPRLPEMKVCNFNWEHHIAAQLFDKHLETCPDAIRGRAELASQQAKDQGNQIWNHGNNIRPSGAFNEVASARNYSFGNGSVSYEGPMKNLAAAAAASRNIFEGSAPVNEEEEDWEAEACNIPPDEPYYDPQVALNRLDPSKGHIIPMALGMAPADRKKYHRQFKRDGEGKK